MTTATPARPDLTVDIKKTTPSKMRTVAKKNMEAFLRNKCAGETIMYSKDGDGYTAARMHRYNGIACGHGPTPYAALGEALALLIPEGLSTDAHMCSIPGLQEQLMRKGFELVPTCTINVTGECFMLSHIRTRR